MAKYYLLHPDGAYSDAADYSVLPERTDGEWVEGEPEGLPVYVERSLADQLKDLFQTQGIEIQYAFYDFVPKVLTALETGRTDIARLIIERAVVPDELKTVKEQMLSLF